MATRKLTVEIVGDASSLERAFAASGRSARTFGQNVQRGALIAGTALTAGLAVAAKVGFSELAEGQKVAAQTAAVLKSTGGAANITARQVDGLAASLSAMSGVDDEAIAASENLLLTFTNVRNEVGKGNRIFDQATRATLDMSVALGTDAKTAALQLGKALNDPEKGMSRLQRVGVTFTDAQKKLVAQLTQTGRTLDAQKVILAEVNREFGGSAEAFGKTLPGQLSKARNAFEEMAAGIVVVLLPAIVSLSGAFSKLAGFLSEHETTAKALGAALVGIAGTLLAVGVATKLYAAGQAIAAAATVAWTAAQWALNVALTANPIGVVVVALAALVAGIVVAWRQSETFRNIVTGAFNAVKAAGDAVLDFFRSNWKIIAVLISGPFAPIVALATDAFGIRSKLIAAGNAILDFFRGAWKAVTGLITAPITAAVTVIHGLVSGFAAAARALGDAIKTGVVTGIGNVASWLGAKLAEIQSAITAAAGQAAGWALQIGRQIVQGVVNGLSGLWNAVKSKIESTLRSLLPSIDVPGFSPLDQAASKTIGQPIIEGAAAGIQLHAPKLLAAITAVLKRLQSFPPLFYDSGLAMGEGLAAGLLDARGKVVDAANELAAAVARSLNVAIDLGRGAAGDAEARRDQGAARLRVGGLATGGIVMSPTLAVVGEAGPEAVIPLSRMNGGGGTVINVNIPNYVGARDELIAEVRRGLYDIARSNPGALPGIA